MQRSIILALLIAALPIPATASKPRLHLERLDPAALQDDRLRLYASAVELEGNVVEDLKPAQFTLLVDGRSSGPALEVRPFEALGEGLDLVLVVETSAQYKKDLDALKSALKDFFEEPPRRMRAMLVPFGSDFELGHFAPAAAMPDSIDDLGADEDSVDLRMADAVGAALTELNKLAPKEPGKAPPRRLIVLVSDGLNGRMDRATFRSLGDRAARAGVPIHTIAFSPADERGPLLNLGELSKRSNGTFRWARSASDLKPQLQTLADEIKKQYVLTFKAPSGDIAKHTFSLRCDEMVSNALGGRNEFGIVPPGRPSMWQRLGGWRWAVGGSLAALLAGLGALVLQRARPAALPRPKRMRPATKTARPASAGQAAAQTAAAGGATGHTKAPAAAGATTLIVIGGTLAGRRVAVRAPITIGKAPGSTLAIADDPTVSGRHAEVGSDARGAWVKDLGSTNGTFVNNQRVSGAGTERLRDGDIVRLGASTQFKVRID